MKQFDSSINLPLETHRKINKRDLYHLAGHAAAIYLGNKQKRLPAVHFQIVIKQQENGQKSERLLTLQKKYSAKIEGGRLIQSLPLAFAVTTRYFSPSQQEQYRCSLEADVINLLAGALAEAKYVAICDDELFTANLVNDDFLQIYGRRSDIELISEYMECYMPLKQDCDLKLKELYLAAFNFVDNRSHWRAITRLVEFIHSENKNIITCEDVISLLRSYAVPATGYESSLYPGRNPLPSLPTAY
jgi:hypothetical protein